MSTSVAFLNKSALREVRENYYLSCNPGALSNKELMISILAPLLKSRPLSVAADDILEKGLQYIASMSEYELSTLFDLDEKSSFVLMSIFELGKRLGRKTISPVDVIRTPQHIADLANDLVYLDKEHFIVFYLNTKNVVIGREIISVGTLNSSLVHPRELFKAAIRQGAASIVVSHNHPSGDVTPSPEDIQITQRIMKAGDIIGIDVLDHVIVGRNGYTSLKEQGYMEESRL